MRTTSLLIVLLSTFQLGFGQQSTNPLLTSDKEAQQKWVDSLYQSMSLKEKVGQLFMIMVFSSQDAKTHQSVIKEIKDNHIGGIIYQKITLLY